MQTIYNLTKGLTAKSAVICAALLTSMSLNAESFKLPDYKSLTLKNGLNVVLMEHHEVPMIDVRVVVNGGVVRDSITGLADITAESLVLGAGERDKQTLDATVDFIGANLNSWASKEANHVSASFAKKDTDLMLATVADVVIRPKFDAEEFEKYRTRYASTLEQRKESPKQVIGDHFERLVYGNHPYGKPQAATVNSLAKITREQVLAYYQTYYQPNNATLIVVGDFDSKTMMATLEKHFASWKNNQEITPLALGAVSAINKSQVLLVDKPDALETTFRIGGIGIARNNKDQVAIDVVNTILGGRFTSWLMEELRTNTGLSYGASSRFSSEKTSGSFYIATFTKKSTTEEAVDLALKTYQRLWEKGIDEATLASAKAYVKGQFPPDYETSSQLAGLLANMSVYGFDASYINDFASNVDQLDVAKAKQIIDTYFPKENLQFVLIGAANDIEAVAKKYGEVTRINITD